MLFNLANYSNFAHFSSLTTMGSYHFWICSWDIYFHNKLDVKISLKNQMIQRKFKCYLILIFAPLCWRNVRNRSNQLFVLEPIIWLWQKFCPWLSFQLNSILHKEKIIIIKYEMHLKIFSFSNDMYTLLNSTSHDCCFNKVPKCIYYGR